MYRTLSDKLFGKLALALIVPKLLIILVIMAYVIILVMMVHVIIVPVTLVTPAAAATAVFTPQLR